MGIAARATDGTPGRRGRVVIGPNTVTKTSSPEAMAVEVAKMVLARKIGVSTGLFVVPDVLEFDEATGTAVLERIVGAVRLCDACLGGATPTPVIERMGRSLAAIHASLHLPEDLRVPLPDGLAASADMEVALHGDLTGANVLIHPDGETPVVIDWQMTDVHGGRATYGTPWFDIAWFANFHFYELFPHHRNLDRAPHVVSALVDGYLAGAAPGTDIEDLARYMGAFVRYKVEFRRHQVPFTTWVRLIPAHRRFSAYAGHHLVARHQAIGQHGPGPRNAS